MKTKTQNLHKNFFFQRNFTYICNIKFNNTIMAWTKEYKDFGAINFNGSKVYVHKTSNSHLLIDIGSGKVVEMAVWAGDGVNITFTESGRRKVRKYTSPNQFVILS